MVANVGPIILLSVFAAISLFAACRAALPIDFQEDCKDARPDFVTAGQEFFKSTFIDMLISALGSTAISALGHSPSSPTGKAKDKADAAKPVKGFTKKLYSIEFKGKDGARVSLPFEINIACYKDPPKSEASLATPPENDAVKANHQKADNSPAEQSAGDTKNVKAKTETTKTDTSKGRVIECKYVSTPSMVVGFDNTREIDHGGKKFCAKCLLDQLPEIVEMSKTKAKRCDVMTSSVQGGSGGSVEW